MKQVNINELEKSLMVYLETRPEDWEWGNGQRMFTKKETIELYKSDKKFRGFIIKQSIILGIDLFRKASSE